MLTSQPPHFKGVIKELDVLEKHIGTQNVLPSPTRSFNETRLLKMSHCQYVTVAVVAKVQSELFFNEKLFSIYFKQDVGHFSLMHKTVQCRLFCEFITM